MLPQDKKTKLATEGIIALENVVVRDILKNPLTQC